MKTQPARGLTLGLVVLFSVTTACGAREPSTPLARATITLTDNACVGEGLGAVIPEHFVATFVNKTSMAAIFNVQRLNDGHAYRELELHIAEQQRRFIASESQLNPPSFTNRVAIADVDPMQGHQFDETLASGTYGVVCRGVKTPLLWSAFVVGPLRVP
jgi:hypothetical protein